MSKNKTMAEKLLMFEYEAIKHAIEISDINSDHEIVCILVMSGASEHLIFYHEGEILSCKAKSQVSYYIERKGLLDNLILPSLLCGEYKIGFTSLFANIRITSNFRQVFSFLKSIQEFTPVHFLAFEYKDIVKTQLLKELNDL